MESDSFHITAFCSLLRYNDMMKLQKRNIILLLFILVGLALRCWFIAVNVIDPRFSAADDGDYYQRALRFAATGEYVDNAWLIRPPLHVLAFSAILWVCINIGEPNWGIPLIRVMHVALSLLTIPIGYGLARRLFNERAGYTFAALLAVWFPMIELPALILSEPLFFFFLLLHLYLLVRWRDERALGWRGTLLLAGAGASIGLAALARSPALYASAFAIGWLVLEAFGLRKKPDTTEPSDRRRLASSAAVGIARTRENVGILSLFKGGWVPLAVRWILVFGCAIALVIAPWATRNYLAYGRFIPTDTLGPVNLWLALTSSGGEGEGKAILASLPQSERQDFVTHQITEIIMNDPTILLRNLWPHFQHIWKAQFIEDFLVKASFYTRPLRDIWPMGLVGDLLWVVFTVGGLVALAAPLRFRIGNKRHEPGNSRQQVDGSDRSSGVSRLSSGDGPFRLLALGWIAYSALIVMLIHIEPRYLLPIWLLMALYGSWAVGDWRSLVGLLRNRRANAALAIVLVVSFFWLLLSYRDYPTILARGWQREQHIAAGQRAYAAGDYTAAEQQYSAAVALQPGFIDGRTDLALALVAQGRYDDALAAMDRGDTHRSNVVRGEIARANGKDELAKTYFTDAEFRAGEDIQALTLDWLRPPRTNRLILGNGLDFGYIYGFSPGEILGTEAGSFYYRWLQGEGRVVLPLAEPLRADSILTLRMAGGFGEATPLQVTVGGQTFALTTAVGHWRTYQLHIPEQLAGQEQLDIRLKAPTFIPAHVYPDTSDTRPLSLMISAVWVQ